MPKNDMNRMKGPISPKSIRNRDALYTLGVTDINSHSNLADDNQKFKRKRQINALIAWPSIFIFISLTLLLLNKLKYHKYPEPKFSNDYKRKDQFFEDLARQHLYELCSFGPKPTGSVENEVKATQYIINQINAIEKLKSEIPVINTITLDVQSVSGAFLLQNFVRTSYYSVYENLQNIVVLLESPNTSKSSLLINCHYDSVIDSPGAGDNTVSCAVMLELLRILYISKEPLKHSIIFLFNGAEENVLQASHGFITQHPWASSIKTFINLDSAGAGGWEVVFQTGPEHPWLVKAYAESAPYPFGSILGQEMFQSGVVPSDTDYRIFRDFGDLSGLDIAYIANGYVYHTQNDRPEYIPTGSIQRAGENMLSVIRHLCSNDQLEDPGADKHGAMVFFDVVGMFMIHYPNRIGAIFNSGVVFIALTTLLLKYRINNGNNNTYHNISTDKTILQALGYSLLSWVLVLAVSGITAVLIDLVGQPMFWFTRTYNIYLVYGVLSFTTLLCFHYYLKKSVYKLTPDWYTESLFFDATLVLFSIFTMVLTYKGFGSAFLPMLWVLGPYNSRYILQYIFKIDNAEGPRLSHILMTIVGQLFPLLTSLHGLESVFTLFIPITGRIGGHSYPDVLIAMLAATTVIICMQYLVGFVYLCSNLKQLIGALFLIIITSLIATQSTSLGFPYSGDRESPTPQRAMFFHINRNFHNYDGSYKKTDSGIWYLPLDHNSANFLQDIPVIQNSHLGDCNGNYCGWPYLYPVIHVVQARESLYSITKPPKGMKNQITVNLQSKTIVKSSPRITRFTLDLAGPDHITMYITPVPGAKLTRWSFTNDTEFLSTTLTSEMNDTTYFIYYSYGTKPDKPYRFFIEIEAPPDLPADNPLVDIAFNGHHITKEDKTTPELEEFKHSLPDWVVTMSWVVTYDSYLF